MSRKYKEIDQDQFESLCEIQCTKSEICKVLGISEKTLNSWCKDVYGETFSLVFSEKKEGGKSSLRRAGWKMAKNNPAVWIFHAKNFLGMSDKPESTGDSEALTGKEIADIFLYQIKSIPMVDKNGNSIDPGDIDEL